MSWNCHMHEVRARVSVLEKELTLFSFFFLSPRMCFDHRTFSPHNIYLLEPVSAIEQGIFPGKPKDGL